MKVGPIKPVFCTGLSSVALFKGVAVIARKSGIYLISGFQHFENRSGITIAASLEVTFNQHVEFPDVIGFLGRNYRDKSVFTQIP